MDNFLLQKLNVKKKKNIKKYFKLIRTRSSVDIVIVGTGPKMRRGFETRTKIAIKIRDRWFQHHPSDTFFLFELKSASQCCVTLFR